MMRVAILAGALVGDGQARGESPGTSPGTRAAAATAAAVPVGAAARVAPALALWRRALSRVRSTSLLRFPSIENEPAGAAVETALLTPASPQALLAQLLDPPAYCRAVPALVRCEGEATGAHGTDPRSGRRVAWELEIPLSNLAGRLEVAADRDWMGVTFRFVEGDLAPGALHFRWQAAGSEGAQGTLLWASLEANVKGASWLLRRLARRDPWTEPAIRAAIVWIAAQAVAANAAHPEGPAPRPQGPMRRPTTPLGGDTPPGAAASVAESPSSIGGLVDLAGALDLAPSSVWASVESSPTGRLACVRLGGRWPLSAAESLRRTASLRVLGAFTGWNKVTTVLSTREHAEITVDDALPFVDLSTRWRLDFGAALEARALSGAIMDAQWAFSARPLEGRTSGAFPSASPSSTVVFSSYPRLDRAGWAPRRFIEAEPFLEHGLALALGYVDLMAAERAAVSDTPPP